MNIKDMSTKAIIWHVVKRHAVFLLILSNVLTITLFTVLNFNRAWANLVN